MTFKFPPDSEQNAQVDELVREMTSTAVFFQERAKAENPLRAAPRLVAGLRQVTAAAKSGRARLIVVARDADSQGFESLAVALRVVQDAARVAEPPIPLIFALSRRKLGAALGLKLKATVIAFFTLENLRDESTALFAANAEAKEKLRLKNYTDADIGGERGRIITNAPNTNNTTTSSSVSGEGGGESGGAASSFIGPSPKVRSNLRVDVDEWIPRLK